MRPLETLRETLEVRTGDEGECMVVAAEPGLVVIVRAEGERLLLEPLRVEELDDRYPPRGGWEMSMMPRAHAMALLCTAQVRYKPSLESWAVVLGRWEDECLVVLHEDGRLLAEIAPWWEVWSMYSMATRKPARLARRMLEKAT